MKDILLSEINVDKEPYIERTAIRDLLIIKRPYYSDDRGCFQEDFRILDIENIIGRKIKILQAQHSFSKLEVLRGIHFEPQDKIITPLSGRIAAAIVDLRKNSDTFKKHILFEFDNTIGRGQTVSLFIPEGLGNSLCVFKRDNDPVFEGALYRYDTSAIYDPKTAGIGVRYDDQDLKIDWPVKDPVISERDRNLPSLNEFLAKYGER